MSYFRLFAPRASTARPRRLTAARATLFVAALFAASIAMSSPSIVAQNAAAPASGQATSGAARQQGKKAPSSPRARENGRSSAKSRAASGSISGRVVADDGQPMPNVTVMVMKRGSTMMPSNTNVPTDADGKFRADDLDPGAYTVSAYAPGYAVARDPAAVYDEPRYYRTGDNVVVTMTKGGVITGVVRDAEGAPVVAAGVRAVYVRDAENRAPRGGRNLFYFRPPSSTDDRGVYRIFGLEPGIYVVAVGGGPSEQSFGRFSLYEGNAPTYYPSTTRDGATEVTVQSGQEASGIDIRYRGERGHTISGKVSGGGELPAFNSGISLILTHAATGVFESSTYVSPDASDRAFSFDGVADGDYEVVARHYSKNRETSASPPRRVAVHGADVTGLNLALAPLASINGRVTLESLGEAERAAGDCANSARRPATPSEAIIVARREEKEADVSVIAHSPFSPRLDAAPDDGGEFTINGLSPGRYRLETLPPGEDWYVRSITFSSATVAQSPQQVARRTTAAQAATTAARDTLLTLSSGQTVSGVNVVLADGAASLRGTITGDAGGQQRERVRVHLIPSERDSADDALRYASSSVAPDGSFALTNLAPGRYWLLVESEAATESRPRLTAWDADTRAKLRRDAEAAANTIDLQPCQRANRSR